MSGFKDREKGFENKFALDEELKFKISSRRRKLLGLWAGEVMGLGDEDALNYAKDIIGFGIDDNSPGAVINKILQDAAAKNVQLTEAQVRGKNAEFEVIASKQVMEEKK